MPFLPSTFIQNEVLNSIKTDTPFLALYTSSPNAGGGGTEVTGGSYSRKAITYGAITAGSMSNSALITYAGLPSATITHYAVLDAATGGNLKGYGALNSPAIVVAGDQLQFTVGSHSISVSGS